MRFRSWSAALGFLAAGLVFPTAHAQEEADAGHEEADAGHEEADAGHEEDDAGCSDEPLECARIAFDDGVKAFQAGDYPTALARFRAAYQLRAHPAIALNLALAEAKSGLYLEAVKRLDAVIEDGESSDSVRETARRERENAARGIAKIVLDVAQGETVQAQVDGQPMEGSPLSADLNPGRHQLLVRRDGRELLRREVDLGVGERLRISVEVAKEVKVVVPTAKPPPPPPPSSNKLQPVWFYGAAGLTVVLGAASVWSGLDTQKAFDDYERDLPTLPQDEIDRRVEDGHSKETRTNVLIGAAALSAVGSAIVGLWFTEWGKPDQATRIGVSADQVILHGSF